MKPLLISIAVVLNATNSVVSQEIPRMNISQFINSIRQQLIDTSKSESSQILKIEVKEINLEIEYVIEVSAEGKASFWVVSTGAGLKGAATKKTTIKLALPEEQKWVSLEPNSVPPINYGDWAKGAGLAAVPWSFDGYVEKLASAENYSNLGKLYGFAAGLSAVGTEAKLDSQLKNWSDGIAGENANYEKFVKRINSDNDYLKKIVDEYNTIDPSVKAEFSFSDLNSTLKSIENAKNIVDNVQLLNVYKDVDLGAVWGGRDLNFSNK